MGEEKVFIGKSLRVFLSYNTDDKKLAKPIKTGLEDYGLDVFLAHEDIVPCAEWETILFQTLKQTDIFMPLLTNNFRKSLWVDQETGIAISDSKFVIPLKVDIDPYGFLSKYQALKVTYKTTVFEGVTYYFCPDLLLEILKIIRGKKEFQENLKDCLIRSFVKSGSFESSSDIASFLDTYTEYSQEQINEIINGSISNPQIYKSFKTKRFLKKFISKYKSSIEAEKITELNGLF